MLRRRRAGSRTAATQTHPLRRATPPSIEPLDPRRLLAAVSWDAGGNGLDWTDPLNWSGNLMPGPLDDVTISVPGAPTIRILGGTHTVRSLVSDEAFHIGGGTLSLAAASKMNAPATLSTGALTGAGDVTFTVSLTWTGDTMSGAGATIIAPGAALNMSGTTNRILARSIVNHGTTNWTGANWFFNGGTFNNFGTFNGSGALTALAIGNEGFFNNSGTFNKNGAGEMAFEVSNGTVAFNNGGQVNVLNGSLVLNSGGSHTGTFTADGSTRLAMGGEHVTTATAAISGPGSFELISGSSVFDGPVSLQGQLLFSFGSAVFNAPVSAAALVTVRPGAAATFVGTVNLPETSSLELSGGSVNFASSSLTFTNGALTAGTLTGSGLIQFTNMLDWNGGTMAGSGQTVVAAGGTLRLAGFGGRTLSRSLRNEGTGTWTSANLSLSNGTFQNAGTLTLNSAAALVAQGNSGTNAFVNSGTLTHAGAGSLTVAASGAPLPFNNSGSLSLNAGTLALRSGGSHTGSFNIATGLQIALAGNHTLAGASSVTGAGDLVVGPTSVGSLAWTGGSMSGSGRLIVSPGSTLSLPEAAATRTLARPLRNDGSVNWTAGDITASGALITNNSAFTINVSSPVSLTGAGVNTFANNGIFTKLGAASASLASGANAMSLANSGQFRVESGSVELGGAVSNSGMFKVFGSATVNATLPAGDLANSGTIDLDPGSLLAVTGGFTQSAGGSLVTLLADVTPATGFGRLTVGGAATLGGTLTATLEPGFDPDFNATFQIVSAGTRSGSFSTVASGPTPTGRNVIPRYATTAASLAIAPLAPALPDLTSISDSGVSNFDNITNAPSPTFTGAAEPGTTVRIFANGALVGSAVATGGSYSIPATIPLDGIYNITADATDADGDPSPGTTVLPIRIDRTFPTAQAIHTPAAPNAPVSSVTLTFDSQVFGTPNMPTLGRNGGPNRITPAQTFNTSDGLSFVLSGLSALTTVSGTYGFTLHASAGLSDVAGNTLTSPINYPFKVHTRFFEGDGNGAANDGYTVRLSADQASFEIFENAPVGPTPTYTLPVSTPGALRFNTLAGNDTVSILSALPSLLEIDAGTGQNHLDLQAGLFTITDQSLASAGPLRITVGGSGNLTFATSRQLLSLTLADNAIASLTPGGSKQLRTASLSIAPAATLGLADHQLLIDAPAPAALDPLLEHLRQRLFSGRNSGAWNGPGISSSAAANDVTGLTGLALTLEPDGDILIRHTWNGDADADGRLTADDYRRIDKGFLTRSTRYDHGDFNFNALIDLADYLLIDQAFLGSAS